MDKEDMGWDRHDFNYAFYFIPLSHPLQLHNHIHTHTHSGSSIIKKGVSFVKQQP
jgi:hypothetical protein